MNCQFDLKLHDYELYGCVYIDKTKEKSNTEKAFNKSTNDKLKGSIITHIDGDPVFSTKDTEKKLEELHQEHLNQNQGMVGNKKNNLLFFIMFAPQKNLLGEKLKKSMDDYNGYAPKTTKTIKSKPLPDLDLRGVDDETTRFPVGTKIFKVFNDVEYKVSVTGYDHKKKLYHIMYEDVDV